MKTLMQLAKQNRNWLMKWIFYPIAAYYASWIIGLLWFTPLVFSLLLVGIQWKRIKRLTQHGDAEFWWLSLFVYAGFAWLVWRIPDAHVSWLKDNGVARYVLVYFGTQAMGELVISRLVTGWRWGRFALANGLAALCWLAGYVLINALTDTWLNDDRVIVWLFAGIPALGTLGNLITGIGLLTAIGDELTNEQLEPIPEIGYVDPH